MKAKIIRTKLKAFGGITAAEKARMDEHARLWISRAMRTAPIEPDKIVPAIKGLYAAAGLKEPRVIIVPSPLVMAFAYGASAAIWHGRKVSKNVTSAATDAATRDATYTATFAATLNATGDATSIATRAATLIATRDATLAATDAATLIATRAATDAATGDATLAATHDATLDATYAATLIATGDATHAATDTATRDATGATIEKGAADACLNLAGKLGLQCARRWSEVYQGGNMWGGYDCYLTACRDILGLELKEHAVYAHWEQAAIHGGFRVMHEEFCLVSDFPEVIKKDERNLPHCESGPSHRWRDGWSLYHWHGVRVPAEWIEDRATLTPAMALGQSNAELRRAACEIIGWGSILNQLNAKVIDADADPEIGTLLRVNLPDAPNEQFLRVQCATGRLFALPVPPDMKTAIQAQAWLWQLELNDFIKPEVST
jgi:hypothetical protein